MRWILAFLLGALGAEEKRSARGGHDVSFQVSTLSELAAGDYDGRLRFSEVGRHGDFGLGTFDRLDGEMVAFDGRFFQVRVDGTATRVRARQTTPFAVVTFFEPELALEIPSRTSCAALQDLIVQRLPSDKLPYAIRVSGLFSVLRTRSVPPQQKPYVPLEEALRDQVEFDFDFVDATMVGFWLPDALANANAAGFHFHALTKDETSGGHVLGCEALDVRVAIDVMDELRIRFEHERRPPRRYRRE